MTVSGTRGPIRHPPSLLPVLHAARIKIITLRQLSPSFLRTARIRALDGSSTIRPASPAGPLACHEAYFADYVRHDLRALFADHGLEPQRAERAHVSKIMTFDKPASAGSRIRTVGYSFAPCCCSRATISSLPIRRATSSGVPCQVITDVHLAVTSAP
jgi:hypothetical protein